MMYEMLEKEGAATEGATKAFEKLKFMAQRTAVTELIHPEAAQAPRHQWIEEVDGTMEEDERPEGWE